MATGAGRERDPEIPRLPIGAGGVALLARNFPVKSGQRIVRLRVIKILFVDLGDVLPVRSAVALRAIGPEASLVLVFVAGSALCRHAEISLAEILLQLHQKASRCRRDILRLVALAAIHAHMLAVEHIAGLGVIESLGRRIPVQQCEILPVVIGVALDAGLTGLARGGEGAVEAAMLLKFCGNLAMAFGAAKRPLAHRLSVALGAIGRSLEAVMGARQGPRRYLCLRGARNSHREQKNARQP